MIYPGDLIFSRNLCLDFMYVSSDNRTVPSIKSSPSFRFYTAMLGKKSSIAPLKAELENQSVRNYAIPCCLKFTVQFQ